MYLINSELRRTIVFGEWTLLWKSLKDSFTDTTIVEQGKETFSEIVELSQTNSTAPFASHVIDTLGVWKKPSTLLEESTAWVSFFERSSPQDQGADVRIMTFQGAKGLEARVVCVLGVEEGTLPRSDDDPDHIAEDSRLFYVSATRAIDELHLFHARTRSGGIVFRNIYTPGGLPDLKPSRFLVQIDREHKEEKYHPA